jgi:hypothetical protein
VVKSHNKRLTRIECLRHVLWSIAYTGKDHAVAISPDPRQGKCVVDRANGISGTAQHPLTRVPRAGTPV